MIIDTDFDARLDRLVEQVEITVGAAEGQPNFAAATEIHRAIRQLKNDMDKHGCTTEQNDRLRALCRRVLIDVFDKPPEGSYLDIEVEVDEIDGHSDGFIGVICDKVIEAKQNDEVPEDFDTAGLHNDDWKFLSASDKTVAIRVDLT